MLKFNTAILVVFFCMSIFSCAGGGPVTPKHLAAGMSQIKAGNGLYQKGCYERALEHYFMAHEQFSASDQLDGVAMSMNNIGNAYRAMNDDTHALPFYDAAYQTYSDLKDNEGMIRVLSNKAAAVLDKGALTLAETLMDQADRIQSRSSSSYRPLLKNRAILHIKKKEYPSAEALLSELLEDVNQEDRQELAAIHVAFGNLMMATGNPGKAIDHYKSALEADQYSGFHKGMADDLEAIAKAYEQIGDDASATSHYERSLKIYALIGHQEKINRTLAQLEKISQRANLDTSITRLFVEKWMEEGADGPCD